MPAHGKESGAAAPDTGIPHRRRGRRTSAAKPIRALTGAIAAVLATGLATTAAAVPRTGGAAHRPQAQDGAQAAARAPGGHALRTVTLITGDRVLVEEGTGAVREVRRGAGRTGIPMSVRSSGGHTQVIPWDALRLIREGTLDRRLFDVTALLAAGYDDAHRRDVPLIVSYGPGRQRSAARADLARAGAAVRRDLPAVRGAALAAPKSGASRVWNALTAAGHGDARTAAPGVARVWLDGKRKAALDKSVPQIGAPTAWKAGYDGKGVKVAVLDTGVDQTHPDLAHQEIAEKNFSDARDSTDRVGHGTHVASTVAGTGAKSGGKYRGVAPGARILDAKVLDDDGHGHDSQIIAGMQWAVDQGAKVANLSLGGDDSPGVDPLEQAVNELSGKGTLFVISAGNKGPLPQTVGTPGSADAALTVGAVDGDDRVANFSSRGPRLGDGAIKPDITAPGVDIVAAKAAHGHAGRPAADGYVSLSGTSMAAPHVAGSAAILAQEHPDWTGQRIKQALTASARPTAGLTPFDQGSGRVDVARAIAQSVVGEQTSLSYGVQSWPHNDDQAVTRKLTYRNTGPAPVTLALTTQATGPDGKPAPAGLFTTGAEQVTVPAHGTATVDVTADTRRGSLDGRFTGVVTATAEGGQSVRTPVAVDREPESYDLTMKHIDGHGKPSDASVIMLNADGSYFGEPSDHDTDGDGTMKVRVPKGRYLFDVIVGTPTGVPDQSNLAWMIAPGLPVTKDTTVTFDARETKPVDITAPDPKATMAHADIGYSFKEPTSPYSYSADTTMDDYSRFSAGQVGPNTPRGRLESLIGTVWSLPGEENAHTQYTSLYSRDDSFFTGFTHRTDKSEFAQVDVTVGAPTPGRRAYVMPFLHGRLVGTGAGVTAGQAMPGTWRQFVAAPRGGTARFLTTEQLADETDMAQMGSAPRAYQPGRTYRETVNVGVFGPAQGTFWRYGDYADLCAPMFADNTGGWGDSRLTAARSTLSADGRPLVQVADVPCFDTKGLPTGSAAYRLSADLRRDPKQFTTSTRITADWTFTSADPGRREKETRLSAVRFTPELTLSSTAKAGQPLTVPVVLDGPAARRAPKKLTVDVSYDEGATWQPLTVHGQGLGGDRYVTVEHPAAPGSVSFRTHLEERSGNTVDETIYRAYTTVR
ncbi:S8 family serine peptidase [Streptomyces sp. B1866]|uniref:S8 family peptidase n=1 Tax=Streptomyces sp. B1866 TaxID=3075431 RepID=UPI00288E56DF|nr:S8 family serine peptidase [Streptomyces sp. B1866]MDT3397225.1 S8 family serine peptidase [Streptomyces sp. B1866]